MSRQKDRHLKRTPRQDLVVECIRAVTEIDCVESVEDHFAGMWDELGFQITVKSDTPDPEVIKLRNVVLASLNDMDAKDPLPFKWLVSFIRNGKSIDVLAPRDQPRDINDALYPL
jgi:hypothetical protein